MDYKKLYLELFNGISNVIEELKKLQIAAEEKVMCELDISQDE